MAEQFTAVGKSLVKPDAVPKVTGTVEYSEDMSLPGMLHGRILRSPHAHAEIRRIDTSKAAALSGVEAVIIAEDAPESRFTRSAMAYALPDFAFEGEVLDQRIISDKARFVGDWIAAVAAVDIATAEQALGLIDVGYELLPAVFDPHEALAAGAPVVHESNPDNVAVAEEYPFNTGDVQQSLADADYTVEFSGKNSRQKHCHLELDSAIASWGTDGRLTLISPSQGPHLAKKAFAKHVFPELGEGDIRWLTPPLGGGFGARLALGMEPVAALLAKVAGKPVKVSTTREEDSSGYSSRTEQHQTIKVGAMADGTLTAIDMDIVSDSGAYYSHSGTTTMVNMQMTLGLLRCPNIRGRMKVVYTNTPTASGFRGYGNPEGAFIFQQAIDMLAEKVGMDPVEFRLKNVKQVGEPSFFLPVTLDHSALEECIQQASDRIGWAQKWQGWGNIKTGRHRRGIGMSVMTHCSGAGGFLLEHSGAMIKLNEDGSANLTVGPSEMGQGILGALSQIAAESMGLKYEDIRVVTGDTDVTLFDIGSHASRSVMVIGNAVADAGNKIREQLIELAAAKLEASADDLEIRESHITVAGVPDRGIDVAQLTHDAIYNYTESGAQISATGSYLSTSHNPNFQAAFAEVDVDTHTGVVSVVRYTMAHDIGRAINPQAVEGQLQGGAVQGLGFALTEDFAIDKTSGETLTNNFATYRIPSIRDIPEMEIILVEDPAPNGPYGAKGVGEPGLVNVAPAIANAVYDAVGVRINSLPLSPKKVLTALASRT